MEPLPPTVSDILADPSRVRARYSAHPAAYRHSRIPPPLLPRLVGRTSPDTPLTSFYRLYEFLVLDWNVQFRNELEYFCCAHPDWAVSSIPDPAEDVHPVCRAVLATLTQLMCAAFNRRVEAGLPRDAPAIVYDFSELAARPKVFEEMPEWAGRVTPLDERYYIPDRDGKVLKENDEDVSAEFKAMNIISFTPNVGMGGLDAIVHRGEPTTWDRFISSPLLFMARWLYASDTSSSSTSDAIRLVCISDTHNTHRAQPPLPDGDILIHAGDLTQSGTDHELDDALAWLNSHPHPHKLFIAGNHDVSLTFPETRARIPPGLTYLENSSVELTIGGRKLLIYGSPHTPKHGSWPFQYPRVPPPPIGIYPSQRNAHEIWSHIPSLTDVLVTHGPPFAHLDVDKYGCYALLSALWHVHPRLHVFGHIHAGRGIERVKWDQAQMVYEDICAGRAGWADLVKLLWNKLTARLSKWFLGDDMGTLLVNAAAVSGLRDDQKKGAIVVDI